MPPSDEQLMLAYAGGDSGAFAALYARHKGALYRYVLRSVRGRGEAEELFQEIWIKVVEARSRYVASAKFATWLFTIAHHRLVDHWRARGLQIASLDDEEGGLAEPAAPPGDEPERAAAAREGLRRFASALQALPLAQREAFLMHEESGLSVAQVAEATGVPEETAKSRLRYAMQKLREAVGDD